MTIFRSLTDLPSLSNGSPVRTLASNLSSLTLDTYSIPTGSGQLSSIAQFGLSTTHCAGSSFERNIPSYPALPLLGILQGLPSPAPIRCEAQTPDSQGFTITPVQYCAPIGGAQEESSELIQDQGPEESSTRHPIEATQASNTVSIPIFAPKPVFGYRTTNFDAASMMQDNRGEPITASM